MILSKAHLLEIFLTKLKLNLKAEVSKTYLGYLWWVLEPALYVAVLYLVFNSFRARGELFVAFLVCGKVPYLWFSKSVVNSANSLPANKGLISQVAIPKAFFPLLIVCQDLVKQFFVFVLMFVFLLLYGIDFGVEWYLVSYLIAVQLLLIVACSLFVASITAFIPDFKYLVSTTMILIMLSSGIFFDYRRVIPPEYHELFLLNPIARLLKNYRQVLMDHQAPDWLALAWIGLASLLVIWIMAEVYRRADNAFSRLVTQ